MSTEKRAMPSTINVETKEIKTQNPNHNNDSGNSKNKSI